MKPAKLCRSMGQLTGRHLPRLSLVLVKLLHSSFPLQAAWIRILHLDTTPASTFTSPLSYARAVLKPQSCMKYTNNSTLRHSDINNKCHSTNKQKTRRFLSVRSFPTSLLMLFCTLIGWHVYCLRSRAVGFLFRMLRHFFVQAAAIFFLEEEKTNRKQKMMFHKMSHVCFQGYVAILILDR